MEPINFKKYDISTPFFSLDGFKSISRLVDIIDGDTIIIILRVFGEYFKFRARLCKINTAEINKGDENTKAQGLNTFKKICELLCAQKPEGNAKEVRSFIRNFLKQNEIIVWIHCMKFDKYGRLLVDVKRNENDEQSISDILRNENVQSNL